MFLGCKMTNLVAISCFLILMGFRVLDHSIVVIRCLRIGDGNFVDIT